MDQKNKQIYITDFLFELFPLKMVAKKILVTFQTFVNFCQVTEKQCQYFTQKDTYFIRFSEKKVKICMDFNRRGETKFGPLHYLF